jgi:hypothetical protein
MTEAEFIAAENRYPTDNPLKEFFPVTHKVMPQMWYVCQKLSRIIDKQRVKGISNPVLKDAYDNIYKGLVMLKSEEANIK